MSATEGDPETRRPVVGLGGNRGAFRLLLAGNPLPMGVYDLETLRLLEVNEAAELLYGYSRAELLAMTIADLMPPEDLADMERRLAGRREVLERSRTWRHLKADGTRIDVEVTSHLLEWGGRPACLAVVQDVTEARRLHSELARRVLYDEETGLPNGRLFADRVAGALVRARRSPARSRSRPRSRPAGEGGSTTVGVVIVGLGGLGDLASTAGDEAVTGLLAEAGRRLGECCGPEAPLGRLSGGRLGVLVEADEEEAVRDLAASIAERFTAAIAVPGAGRLSVPVRVGVAFAGGAEDADTLVRGATWAMRHSLDLGRPAVYDQAAHAVAVEASETGRALEGAASEGQLRLHYQPVVGLGSHTVLACESLLRWQRPGVGLVGPDRFIPIAERSGLIIEMGSWVIERAIADAASWPETTGTRPRVAVNLTARQLSDEHLVGRFAAACSASGLPGSAVGVELTETTLVGADDRGAYRALAALRDAGVEVAIDDFGTGYSSLAYLKRLPVDVVKVDRSFVVGLGVDPADRLLVEAVIALAHGLGLRVVAEGVETTGQLEVLAEIGCDAAQGFLLARPAPPDELAAAIGAALAAARGSAPPAA